MANQATIVSFGLVSYDNKTLFAKWDWNQANTESYQIRWEYLTKNWPNTWMVGNSGENSIDEDDPDASKQSTFSIPNEATTVRFMVKPIAKKKSSNSETRYWQADWSVEKRHNVSDNPPSTPETPTVEFKDTNKFELVAQLSNIKANATVIRFQIVRRPLTSTVCTVFANSSTTIQYADSTDAANLENGRARYSCVLEPGYEYMVRAKAIRDSLESDWSAYTSSVFPPPSTPSGFTSIGAKEKNAVAFTWEPVAGSVTYDIQYALERDHFDTSNATTTETGIAETRYIWTGLETGDEYFFRLRAVGNSGVASDWSEISSIILGTAPGAPTTWSSTTTAVVGEPVVLYWIHNSEDGSSQTSAELELTIGGIIETFTIQNDKPEDEKDKTSSYIFETNGLTYGSTILWRVRTKGVLDQSIVDGFETEGYGEWSIERTVEVFPLTTVGLRIVDGNDSGVSDSDSGVWTLTRFPMRVSAKHDPIFQKSVGYYLKITAGQSYETVDVMGNTIRVAEGETIFSRNYNTSDGLDVVISAGDVTLENNVTYILSCEASMESGLTAEASIDFNTAWSTDLYWPNAEVGVDPVAYTATICPYCMDDNGKLVENHTLAVYRRNYDGSLTEIMRGIDNDRATHITDPHPALDYARYRIVATSTETGVTCSYDMPGVEVGGHEFVIQWDEAWSNYNHPDTYTSTEPTWAGSMLRLPYNISVSESVKLDVAHVEYIGRRHPVSYHGTHLGESCTWSAEIPKSDVETLYTLRRLARWTDKVYVREPSGIGYWATIGVSLSQKYRDMTIPISLSITRVEGGV